MTMLLLLTLVSTLLVIFVFACYLFYKSKKFWLLQVAFFEVAAAFTHMLMCFINISGYASAKPVGWWVVSGLMGIGFAAICTKAKIEAKI